MNSYSEQRQDVFAYEHVSKPLGTFLDVGCWNPVVNNNSYGLEQLGWRGVLIDIDDQWETLCKRERKNPFKCVDALKVNWQDVCIANDLDSHIDYLSLDIDDHVTDPFSKTLEVLGRMISAGLSFRAITVEHDAYRLGNEPRASIRKFLAESGYQLHTADVSCHPGDPDWTFEDWFLGEEK